MPETYSSTLDPYKATDLEPEMQDKYVRAMKGEILYRDSKIEEAIDKYVREKSGKKAKEDLEIDSSELKKAIEDAYDNIKNRKVVKFVAS